VIEGYIGLIGHGKTMLAVDHARTLALRRGALLASNIRVDPPPGVAFRQLSVGDDGFDLEELRALLEEPGGVVLLIDEIGIIMPARFWSSFPVDLMFAMSQSRKLGLDVIYTSQDVEQVDSFVRRLTQWVYKVRCWPAPSLERREGGKRPWLFRVTQWRPVNVDKADKKVGGRWVRYQRKRETWYDTDELVRPAERLARRSRARSKGTGGRAPGVPPPSILEPVA